MLLYSIRIKKEVTIRGEVQFHVPYRSLHSSFSANSCFFATLLYFTKSPPGLSDLSSKCSQLVLMLVKHVYDASQSTSKFKCTKHKLCLNLNKCLKNQKLKLIINNILRSAWQQEMKESVISIEQWIKSSWIKNSIRQEVSIHIPLQSEIMSWKVLMSWKEESQPKWDWLLEKNNMTKPKQILNVIYSYRVKENL